MADGGTANVGFFDQRLAIQWVNKFIHLFGGDPNQITLLGESAGASSIMHHLTASGGKNASFKPQFQRAVLQSPAFLPQGNNKRENHNYEKFLEAVGVKDLDELRKADSSKILNANAAMIFNSTYGQFTFGPGLDGSFVNKPPALNLKNGDIWPGIEVIVANNGDEGIVFTPPNIQSLQTMKRFISESFPLISERNVDEIVELYPFTNTTPAFPFRDWVTRLNHALTDLAVDCNTYLLVQAYGNTSSYKYYFDVLPGLHGQDIPFTFFQLPPPKASLSNIGKPNDKNFNLAQGMQWYIANFAMYGNPNGNVTAQTLDGEGEGSQPLYPHFPPYQSGGIDNNVVDLYQPFIWEGVIFLLKDPVDADKCAFWGSAPYYSKKEGDEKRKYALAALDGQTLTKAHGEEQVGLKVKADLK
jgi:acetylcholinesterase